MIRPRSRKHPIRNALFTIALLLGALSAFQYVQQGAVTWHIPVWSAVQSAYDEARASLLDDQPAPIVVDRSEPLSNDTGSTDARLRTADDATFRRDIDTHRFELVGRVTDVVDGDSFEMRVNDLTVEIRLHGVDTPEYDQPHGDAASRALSRKISRRNIFVEVLDIDSYDRLVGKIYRDGEYINLYMVEEGHGWWYEQYARSDRDLRQAQQSAIEAGLGLWADSNPVAPWEWRRRN